MEQIIELLSLPFMQRALIGGSLVALFSSITGIFAVLRGASFFGDAVSHASLAGIAIGIFLGFNPILSAAVFGIIFALIIPYLQKLGELRVDTVLGFLMPFSMALGVMILGFLPGYQPELISFLFGSILSISWAGILVISAITLTSLIIIFVMKRKLLSVSFDEEYARVSGIKVDVHNLLLNVLLALAVVSSIRLVGVILVTALLVIPSATSKLFAKSINSMFILSPIIALLSIFIGLFISYFLNIPSGPSIVIILGLIFVIGLAVKGKNLMTF